MAAPGKRLLLLATPLVLALSVTIAGASEIETVKWAALRDKDITPEGKAALSINDKSWLHAESEHFVYHFTDEGQAHTVYVNAEVYYRWIKDFFGVEKDEWAKKNHIFVLTDKAMWDNFVSRVYKTIKPQAFTNGWELYIYRPPDWVKPRRSLAHEMTHVIVFRFLDGPLPIFLNEGFAEYASGRLVDMQLEHAGYDSTPKRPVGKANYTPLKELNETDEYPVNNLADFYAESELFVQFLVDRKGNEELFKFLREISKGRDFKKLVEDIYDTDLAVLEEDFKNYAVSKD